MMISYQKLIFSIEGLFFPEMLTRRVQREKVLHLHGGWLPYGHYSCSKNGLKLILQMEI